MLSDNYKNILRLNHCCSCLTHMCKYIELTYLYACTLLKRNLKTRPFIDVSPVSRILVNHVQVLPPNESMLIGPYIGNNENISEWQDSSHVRGYDTVSTYNTECTRYLYIPVGRYVSFRIIVA